MSSQNADAALGELVLAVLAGVGGLCHRQQVDAYVQQRPMAFDVQVTSSRVP